jgi:hypothetical protein
MKLVGMTGFEPATSRTPSVRATRLRYIPNVNFQVSPIMMFCQTCRGASRLLPAVLFLVEYLQDFVEVLGQRDKGGLLFRVIGYHARRPGGGGHFVSVGGI